MATSSRSKSIALGATVGLLTLLTLLALALVGGSARGAAAAGSARPVSGVYVGKLGDTGAFIGVAAGTPSRKGSARRGVAVYVCDGSRLSVWYRFPATSSGNTVELKSKEGAVLRATLTRRRVTGTVELPGKGTVSFRASRATGIGGIYLVNRSIGRVHGIGGAKGRPRLNATVTRTAKGRYTIDGTVGRRAIKGTANFFGSPRKVSTWIVLPNGRVKGLAGGGWCGVWRSIKSAMTGVYCRYL